MTIFEWLKGGSHERMQAGGVDIQGGCGVGQGVDQCIRLAKTNIWSLEVHDRGGKCFALSEN
jgi:hypothetical protein